MPVAVASLAVAHQRWRGLGSFLHLVSLSTVVSQSVLTLPVLQPAADYAKYSVMPALNGFDASTTFLMHQRLWFINRDCGFERS